MAAMTAYRPFLLPALQQLQPELSEPEKPANPLEDEVLCLRHWEGAPESLWEAVSPLLSQRHGLPLLFREEPARRTPCRIPEVPTAEAMRLTEVDQPLFLLSHPASLPLFDGKGRAEDCPVLVLPSLYRHWRRGLEREGGRRPAVTGQSSGGQEAFFKELRSLLERGNPSDWHLEPTPEGYRSRVRAAGGLRITKKMNRDKGRWFLNMALAAAGCGARAAGQPVEGNLSLPARGHLPSRKLRLSVVPALHGDALVLRFLDPPEQPRNLREIGLPSEEAEKLQAELRQGEGMVLTAGPTGSGKSTTLHAFLRLAVQADEKILAAEDPVETQLAGVQQVAVDPSRGLGFAEALRAFLRQSPDSLLVGEIRDSATASVAVEAARTGHRVYSSLHAASTRGVLRRLEDLGQSPREVEAVCLLLLHQRMLPSTCRQCAIPCSVPPQWKTFAEGHALPIPEQLILRKGCPSCCDGIAGRRPIFVKGRVRNPENTSAEFLERVWRGVLSGGLPETAVPPFLPAPSRGPFSRLPSVSSL
ncbi:MAG: hypothetical protein GVY10_12350 [Verrucomicrobia bacterium]|jgi:Tfp pilus assembly pilus retraction ATPase PilT|nr:hypothetical protein [Verrucomicrobiota bacterium]